MKPAVVHAAMVSRITFLHDRKLLQLSISCFLIIAPASAQNRLSVSK
jgi:hypothetical protein